jgi:hypothetical protein
MLWRDVYPRSGPTDPSVAGCKASAMAPRRSISRITNGHAAGPAARRSRRRAPSHRTDDRVGAECSPGSRPPRNRARDEGDQGVNPAPRIAVDRGLGRDNALHKRAFVRCSWGGKGVQRTRLRTTEAPSYGATSGLPKRDRLAPARAGRAPTRAPKVELRLIGDPP